MVGVSGILLSSYSRYLAEVLIIAGGGGGGTTNTDNGGGGGGGGGYIFSIASAKPASSFSITIGAGGPIMSNVSTELAARGGNSIFGSITAAGGGTGGGYFSNFSTQVFSGTEGGSSGGGSVGVAPRTPSPIGQGNIGGYGYNGWGGGGGGGSATAGGNAISTPNGLAGKGGDGKNTLISGASLYFGGGGGGGAAVINQTTTSDLSNAGGLGGGGKGQGASWASVSGTTNTGGGGGGGLDNSRLGKNGGSGIVILAYASNLPNLSSIGAGLTYTLDTVTRTGFKVYKFTGGTGTVTF